MKVGAYTLDLYCDKQSDSHGYKEFPHQFVGKSNQKCIVMARRAGWKLSAETDLCPKCSNKKTVVSSERLASFTEIKHLSESLEFTESDEGKVYKPKLEETP